MEHKLVIAEKPSVALSIAKVVGANNKKDGYYEGNGYKVSWCVGHLIQMANPDSYDEKYGKWNMADLPIIPKDYKYEVAKSTKKQFNILKKLMNDKEIDTVINACDAGREGEAIFRLVYNQTNCKKKMKRLWISSMEDSSIKDGFDHLKDGKDYENLFESAQARAIADWLVGMNISRLYSCLYKQNYSVGRVQTPTLAMIVKRGDEIVNFKKEKYYTVELSMNGFTLSTDRIDNFDIAEQLQNLVGETIEITDVIQKEKITKPDSTFGETQSAFELSPEGTGYRVKTRFSKFYNLPELMSMFKEVADIQTADMLNLPTPEAHYEVVKTMPSDEQKEILKGLSERADKVRNREVEPEEDNMLKITNDGKKLALDQRLINPLLPDNPDSKVNVCVKNVFSIWDKTKENKSTQLLFSDMSTPKGDGEFNIYDDIRDKLVAMGIPKEEIAFIHEANSDKQKDELFAKVRKGEIRILMGSTQKMGAGTNVQNKLIAMHDLDVPWRPADLEQRAGRIVRQGNENKEVNIYRYITENTFDAYLWQTIENKQKFISQIMTSKTPVRVAEDVDESSLNYAEIKALATGDPKIKEKMDLDNEVTKLKMLEANYKSNRYRLEDKIAKTYPDEIAKLEKLIEAVKKDISSIEPQGDGENKFTSITINGVKIADKKEAGERLLEVIKTVKVNESKVIGKYRNMDLEVSYNFFTNEHNFSLNGATKHSGELGTSADGNITRLDNALEKMPEKLKRLEEKLISTKEQLENAKEELKKPFEKADELKTKVLRLAELNKLLDMGEVEEKENPNPLVEDVKRAIIDFCNREYEENHSYDEFNTLYPDLKHIGIAYTNTPDEKHEIQFELNLEDFTATQLVNGKEISHYDYIKENGSEEKALDCMKFEMENGEFSAFVSVDEEELKQALGLEMDDEGNFYDPLAKDLDNDGVPDRYDNDFRDSDYFETTYDVEDNLNAKEEKPSILGQIKSFQSEQKEKEVKDTKSKEHDER